MDNGCDELDRLMSALRVSLPGATDGLIKMTLFDAIDRHLRRTNAWRYETDIVLTQGTTEYSIFPPAGTSLVRVLGMSTNGRSLAATEFEGSRLITGKGRLTADFMQPQQAAGYYPDREKTEGDVLRYAVYYPTYIEVDVPPSSDATRYPLQALLAITLSPECKCDDADGACDWSLDPWMYERYHDDWFYGTLHRMMAMPSKPWSNLPMAVQYGKVARSRENFAKQEADRGFVHDVQVWRFPRGGWIR